MRVRCSISRICLSAIFFLKITKSMFLVFFFLDLNTFPCFVLVKHTLFDRAYSKIQINSLIPELISHYLAFL